MAFTLSNHTVSEASITALKLPLHTVSEASITALKLPLHTVSEASITALKLPTHVMGPLPNDGEVSLTIPALSAIAWDYDYNSIDVALPRLSVATATGNDIFITIPKITPLGSGAVGTTITASIPKLTVVSASSFEPYISLSLPIITVDASISLNEIEFTLPKLQIQGIADSGAEAIANIAIPLIIVAALGSNNINVDLPVYSVSSTSIQGTVSSAAARLPTMQLIATAISENQMDGGINLPRLSISATVSSENLANTNFIIPMLSASARIISGTSSSVVIELPLINVQAQGHGPQIASGSFSLPIIQVFAAGSAEEYENYRTWVLNIQKSAVTEYRNLAVNSACIFNGKALIAGPDGIFELDNSNTDDGTQIDASVTTGATDFGTNRLTRLDRIYVGYKATGNLTFHTITSQDGQRKYLLSHNMIEGIQHRRVQTGLGPKARYWQFGLANKEGSDFYIDSLALHVKQASRKII